MSSIVVIKFSVFVLNEIIMIRNSVQSAVLRRNKGTCAVDAMTVVV